MKKLIYLSLVLVLSACQKPPKDNPVYTNSESYISWTLTPLIDSGKLSQGFICKNFICGWNFGQLYEAPRAAATAHMSPYYGFPVGAVSPDGKLSFNYCNSNCTQAMSLFFSSAAKATAPGTYNAQACFENGYVARLGMAGSSKNLYLSGETQQIIIDSYMSGFAIEGKVIVTVLKGRFLLRVADSPNGANAYTISGKFQLPLPSNN